MPNVIGMTYKDALYLLEKRGLKVNFSGSGRVKKQSVSPGKNTKNYSTIHLSLRWKKKWINLFWSYVHSY